MTTLVAHNSKQCHGVVLQEASKQQWLLNGFVATYEDDPPAGFNNPDGASTPTYVQTERRIAKYAGLCVAIVPDR